ncbi:MAG: putative N-acetylglucosamine kinase, glucokinase-like [Rhodanobacteraceae bacterium]|jgi:glucokinase|nr:MAG: putative N-acetylglucosamine kinase, glucokinase-like [Rhodanobacteraceae bacterium]
MKHENKIAFRGEDPVAMRQPQRHDRHGDATTLVLAADVGGTHARIGLLRARAGAQPPLEMLARHVYECAKWPGLGEILQDFLSHHPDRGHIARCALAVAGYLRDDELVSENLRWPVRISELRECLQLDRLDIVNDFEALACGTRFLSTQDSIAVIEAQGMAGPTVVVGPGTGLGCAVLLPNGDAPLVMPSEAGHVALAPGNDREIEVLRRLGRDRDYVHTGLVLSGPGLLNLYRALAEIEGAAATHAGPQQVSAAALQGDDPLACEALSMFCGMLGSFAGDLAIMFKADGGVYLAGGILPHISDFLLASEFRTRFLNKGVMREFLAAVPVRLIEHGQLGVFGAAAMEIEAAARAD